MGRRVKQANWLPGFTQLFLVCLRSQPFMICRQTIPIQVGMASTQEKRSPSTMGVRGGVSSSNNTSSQGPCCPNTQETSHFACPFVESGIEPGGVGVDTKDACSMKEP